MKIYYDLKNGRLNVYRLENSVLECIGSCEFNSESYFIGDLNKRILEICVVFDGLEIATIREFSFGIKE